MVLEDNTPSANPVLHSTPVPDLVNTIRTTLPGCDIRTDLTARLLYSTDASIYQIEPLGVAFPRNQDDLSALVEASARYGVPILARGAGSSLAGQAIGPALIIDCSRYLNRLVEVNPEQRLAVVEPGLVLAALNRRLAPLGLQYGPDPASAERATMGGVIANNAAGAHSIIYGMAADHILAADVLLSGGQAARFEPKPLEWARRRAAEAGSAREPSRSNSADREAETYRCALHLRATLGEAVRENWPRTWRRASGYSLNYLFPWSPSAPPMWAQEAGAWGWAESASDLTAYPPGAKDAINLALLLAGSEGTLAVIRQATVRLTPLPRFTALGVLSFSSLIAACDAVPHLLEAGPSAIELIPQALVTLARSVPAYAAQLAWVDQLGYGASGPAAMLVVEFTGETAGQARERVLALGAGVLLAQTAAEQRQVWGVRKVGLGLMLSRAGDFKPWPFIEDLAVPVERLGEFVREMTAILAAHGVHAEVYAHASAGCLHFRPVINLKTVQGIVTMRAIATQAVTLTLRLGGSVSGEHGDGLARSEWLERMFGAEITAGFRMLKDAADPERLLNPGKIVDAPPMDTRLRFGEQYQAAGWQPKLNFSAQAGLEGAIEQCNGAGVCRKMDGVMCPSFQATEDEMHSTRGRANLLRALISGRFPTQKLGEKAVYQALDLCLACKGCKAECPSAVDMAKLKYEFMDHYYARRPRPLRDYIFGYIDHLARVGQPFAPVANALLENPAAGGLGKTILGISRLRRLPKLQGKTFRQLYRVQEREGAGAEPQGDPVLLLVDAFTEYFYPQAGMAAVEALTQCGCRVEFLPVTGAGRTLLSKGFIEPARRHARQVVDAITRLDPQGQSAIVGVEPSEILMLREEYPDLLPGDERVRNLGERAWMIDEFLVRVGEGGKARILRIAEQTGATLLPQGDKKKVLLHGHCYQKAQPPAADGYPTGVAATVEMLKACGYTVEVIDSGCCGMAGAFGYEADHYDLSLRIANMTLLPAVRAASDDTVIAASGVSCQAQIQDGAQRTAVHPIQLVA